MLAAAVVFAACTGGSAPPPDASPVPATPAATAAASLTPAATAAATPAPSPSPPPASTGGIAELGLAIASDTRWGDLFGTLTPAERSCFRNEFGDGLEERLAQPIGEGANEAWEAEAFACLAPATARAVFLESLLADMAEDFVEPDASELACLRATVAAADIPALISAVRDGDEGTEEFRAALLTCLPGVFLDLMLVTLGLDPASLRPGERACLTEAFQAGDWVALGAGDEAAGTRFAIALFGCVPALYLSELVGEEVALSEADAACLRAAFENLDAAELIAAYEGDIDSAGKAFGASVSCVPRLMLENAFGAELELELSAAEASCLRESFAGLQWDDRRVVDPDAAVAVELVRCVPDLFVPMTLRQAGAGLGDVSEDEIACMREWAAGLDGNEQLAVLAAGDEITTAELGAGLIACASRLLVPGAGADAAPVPAARDATPVAVGTSVEATLAPDDFADIFVFEAERGTLYRIDVSPGTLTDPTATLYDADWLQLGFSDAYTDSLGARIFWEATYSGAHYIEVQGYDSGSYTISVVAR